MAAPRVLIVDDEPSVRTALTRALESERYQVATAADGIAALERLGAEHVDLVLLDVAMPNLDGLQTCRRLRDAGNRVPVLMLTARDAVPDRVAGLEAGADDYLVKPFALQELFARIKALLRRVEPDQRGLSFADLRIEPGTRDVYRGDRRIELTRTEHQLLELFLSNPRQLLSRTTIFERVWGYDFGMSSNSLNVYVGYLRRKLEDGGEPRLLHTVRGQGYILRDDL